MKAFIFVFVALCATITTYSQKAKNQSAIKDSVTIAQVAYTCPMHPEVVSTIAGKCPKCDRDLQLSNKEHLKMEVMKLYACSMHPEEQSKNSGTCPKCHMALTEVKPKAKSKKG